MHPKFRKLVLATATVIAVAATTVALPGSAEARCCWRGGAWGCGCRYSYPAYSYGYGYPAYSYGYPVGYPRAYYERYAGNNYPYRRAYYGYAGYPYR
jgi:hypothetical protein